MTSREEDQELRPYVDRVRNGDREAFRVLVERFQGRLYGLCFGLLQNREEALDVTQEAFLKAWRSIDTFRGDSNFYTWLYRIASNLSLDALRRRSRRGIEEPLEFTSDSDEEEKPKPFSDPKSDPVRPIDQKLLANAIRSAVRELPLDQQMVIVLREIDGMSYSEIAKVMKCRVGTVMSRLFYARKKLQDLLKDIRKSMV